MRKRDNLPEDSKYRDPKYNHAFAVKVMSDDEDQIGNDGKKTGFFVSHAPLYRSQEVSFL